MKLNFCTLQSKQQPNLVLINQYMFRSIRLSEVNQRNSNLIQCNYNIKTIIKHRSEGNYVATKRQEVLYRLNYKILRGMVLQLDCSIVTKAADNLPYPKLTENCISEQNNDQEAATSWRSRHVQFHRLVREY